MTMGGGAVSAAALRVVLPLWDLGMVVPYTCGGAGGGA